MCVLNGCGPWATNIMLMYSLKYAYLTVFLNAFVNGCSSPVPPTPTKEKLWHFIYFFACQLVPQENEDPFFFWGGGGGACQLKMLVPPTKTQDPQCPPPLKKSYLRHCQELTIWSHNELYNQLARVTTYHNGSLFLLNVLTKRFYTTRQRDVR